MNDPQPDQQPDLRRARRRKDAAIDLSKIDRLPPHSIEAEQGMLGCMLLSPVEAIGVAVEKKVRTDAFYDLRHQSLFLCLLDMWDERTGIDIITVRQRLKDAGQLDQIGGVAYLTALSDATPSAANMPFYADIVIEKHTLRRMINTCSNVIGRIYDESDQGGVEELMDEAEADVLKIRQDTEETASLAIKDLVHGAIAEIEQLNQNKGKTTGLTTGLADLDKITSGLQNGDMIVIAARPSMGKSSLGMNIAEHVAIDLGLPVGVFSLEMTARSLTLRTLCSRARVNHRDIQDGFLHERDFPKLTNAAGKMAKSPLFIDDTAGLSILQLRAKARRMHQQHGIKLFVVDYLQLVRTSKKCDRRDLEIADISSGLKALAKELNVPFIVLAQLNREVEKRGEGDRPRLSDLREGGAIEQDADVVGLLYRPKIKDNGDDEPCAYDAVPTNLLIAKQRNGPTGDIFLTFLKSFTRFEGAAKVSEEDQPEFPGGSPGQ